MCLYAFAQGRCLDLAEPSRQRCLASLKDPSPPTAEEIRESAATARASENVLGRENYIESKDREWKELENSIARDLDRADQDRRMDDMKRDTQQQLDELRAERDRKHLRYLDSESDR
jgi:hypothetical protein